MADWQSNSLTVINGSTDRVIASILVVQRPEGVAVDSSTNLTYVTSANYRGVSVINDATNTLENTIDAPPGMAIATNPVTHRIYIANTNTVTVIDTYTRAIVDTVTVGFLPVGIAVNPVTNRIYVGNQNTNDVSVIDGSTDTVLATIPVPLMPSIFGVDADPATNRVYVANDGPISVIDGSTNTVIANIPLVGVFNGLAVNHSLKEVYVSDQLSFYGGPPPVDKLVIVNTTSNTQIANVTVGAVPSGIGVDQTSGRIFVDGESSDTMSVIDASKLTLVDTIILDPTIKANPSTVNLPAGGTGISTATVTTYPNTRLGTYYFYLYGNSSVGVHSITLTLQVGDFALSASPASLSVAKGSTISSTITVTSLNGYWTLNVTGAASGQNVSVHISPSNATVVPGAPQNSTILIDTSNVSTAANFTLTVTGLSGTVSHSTNIAIRTTDFAVSANSTQLTFLSGSTRSLIITATSLNGFSGIANLRVASSPSGLTCSLSVSSIALPSSGNSSLACIGSAGNYVVTVTGTSGTLMHSIKIPVTVNLAGGGGPPSGEGTSGLEIYVIVIVATLAAIAVALNISKRMMRRKSSSKNQGINTS